MHVYLSHDHDRVKALLVILPKLITLYKGDSYSQKGLRAWCAHSSAANINQKLKSSLFMSLSAR
jgi:hypothetical protein